jgi:hypothetical protein
MLVKVWYQLFLSNLVSYFRLEFFCGMFGDVRPDGRTRIKTPEGLEAGSQAPDRCQTNFSGKTHMRTTQYLASFVFITNPVHW